MREIIWLDSAIDDITRLRQFIAKDNTAAAMNAANTIKNSVNKLAQTPLIGKPVTDLLPYRDLLARFGAGGYVIRYRIQEDNIYIVHVRHYRETDFKI